MTSTRDIVVRCDGAGHRVRLRGGHRFLSRAACPTCGAPVDPLRWRRCARALTNLRRPRSSDVVDRLAWLAALLAVAAAASAALLLWGFSDIWWPATVLLYGPRWTLLLPLVPVVALAVWRDRALLVPVALAGLIVLGPVMGFRTGWRSVLKRGHPTDITLASFNVAGGLRITASPTEVVERLDADVIAFQECGPAFARLLRDVPERHVDAEGPLCLASRFPIRNLTEMDRSVLESVGGSGLVTTYTLDTPGGTIYVNNLHLDTPRAGLELIRSGRIPEGIRRLREKSLLREIELRRAERQTRQSGSPAVALGDFNTPPESRLYRAEWAGWTNAFTVAGTGLGGTRLNGWIQARIDHVMLDDSWTVIDSWLGPDMGSDHRPIMARVRLSGATP